MTELLSDLEAPSDAELISRVRGGDVASYGELFSRHRDAANRLARQLVRGPDSDDLVSEAFAKVLSVLQGGGGPDVAFRAYLLTSVRRLHVDRIRAGQRLQTTDDLTPFDPGVPFQDTAVAGFESGAAAKAFASLPERWQLVLWHLEVEGQKPADIAPLLGMSANSVSALAYRAREGLRQAFLTMHIADLTDTDCRWVNEHLGGFIRKGLSQRDSGKVQSHLDGCRRCTAMYLELTEVNSNLAGIIAPLLLGAAASGYIASGGAGAAGIGGLLAKVKELVGANTVAVTAAGVTIAVAAAGVVAAMALGGTADKDHAVADSSPSATAPADPAASLPVSRTSPSAAPSASASASATGTLAPSTTPAPLAPAAALGPLDAPPESPPAADTATDEEPGDGTPGGGTPGDGTPGDPGTDTPATPSTVNLAGTTVDEDGVHLKAIGSPALPPTMTVHLLSDPGVTFAGGDDTARCSLTRPTVAECSTIPGGSGARMPGTAKMAASSPYTALLPFTFVEGLPDTDINISVDVPTGYEVSGGSGSVATYRSRTADVSLQLDDPIPYSDAGYPVTTHLGGVPAGYTGAVRITLTDDGAASIVGSTTSGCSVDAGDLVCMDPADGVVGVTVDADDSTAPTSVTLHASALTGFRDPTGANNTGTTKLLAEPPAGTPDQDVSFSGVPDQVMVDPDTGDYSFTGAVTGVPLGYSGKLHFSVTTGSASFAASEGCDLVDTSATLLCDANNGSVHLALSVPDTSADTPVTLALAPLDGYTDTNDLNNTQGTLLIADLPPATPDADLSLTLSSSVSSGGDGGYVVPGTLAGVPDGYVGQVRYSVMSGTAGFVPTAGCTVESSTLVCDDAANGPVSLRLAAVDDSVDTVVDVAVLPLADHTDDNNSNNTAPVTLRKNADLALALVSPVAADPDGGYTVTGTLTGVPDGYAEQVTFTLSGDPANFSAAGCTPIAQTLVCDVPADGTVAFDVAVEDNSLPTDISVTVGPLTGYTDVDGTDNQAHVTLQAMPVPPSKQVDVTFAALAPGVARPGPDDTYTLSGALSLEGPAAAAVKQVTYSVSGALFVTNGGTTSTITRSVDETEPSFMVTHPGPSTVSITADATGFDETHSADNTAGPFRLQPYDVSLVGLQAAPGTADEHGDQTFTATLDTDGYGGDVTYSLAGSADLSLAGPPTISGEIVTFTVHSTATDRQPTGITISTVLPLRYTDSDGSNDGSEATYTYYATPVAFGFDGAITATGGSSSKPYRVTGNLRGIPSTATTVTLSFPDNQERFVSTTMTGCTLADRSLACPTNGATTMSLAFGARLPGNMDIERNGLDAAAGGGSTTSTTITFP